MLPETALGLAAVGVGQRYSTEKAFTPDGQPVVVHLSQMDGPLLFVLVFLTSAAVVGLGVSFLGLAYHHRRREREHEFHKRRATGGRPSGIVVP